MFGGGMRFSSSMLRAIQCGLVRFNKLLPASEQEVLHGTASVKRGKFLRKLI